MGLTYPSSKVCPKCGTGGYVWYLDNSKYVAKCTNCGHYFQKEDFPMCVLDSTPKPKTNADRIRNMSDEELAEIIKRIRYCDIPIWCDMNKCREMGDCLKCRLAWLRQEGE